MLHGLQRHVVPILLASLIALAYASIAYLSVHKIEHSLLFFLGLSGFVFLAIYALHELFELNKRTVFIWALLFHAIGFLGAPLFEDDHYRYLWDGYRTAETGLPYGMAPEVFFSDKNTPNNMRQVLSGINNPEVPTIYGPVLQGVFSLGYLMSPAKIWPVKLILIFANLSLIFLLLKNADSKQVMLYAWNPLVFKEIALTSHPDGLVALIIFIAWLTRDHWQGRVSGVLFGVALAVKISALPALAWLFWKRQYLAITIALAVFFACYLPFLGAGSDWSGFKVFAREWEFNSGLYALFAMLLPANAAKLLCMSIAGLGMLWVMRGKAAADYPPWHRLFGILLLFSPVVNAWYLLWFLPLAVMHQDRWPWWASAAVLLSYVTGQNLGDETMYAYGMPAWVRVIEWSTVIVAVGFDLFKQQSLNLFVSKQPLANH
jgi:alpha-1,6-mannosyltransferase